MQAEDKQEYMYSKSPSLMEEQLLEAEGLIMQGQDELARQLLSRLAEDAEEYIADNCQTTEELQWFSFPSLFERLAYRRVENDPRRLKDVGEPLDRLYSDLALAEVHLGDYDSAAQALKFAIRWNPMACEHRLNLADICRVMGDMQESLALSYSVFERASDPSHLVRAYLNFVPFFISEQKPRVAAAALLAAERLGTKDTSLLAALSEAKGSDHDPHAIEPAQVAELLGAEGLPDGANAEIAICLLMCASDAAAAHDRDLACKLTIRARDLVGEDAAMALMELINSTDDDATDSQAE